MVYCDNCLITLLGGGFVLFDLLVGYLSHLFVLFLHRDEGFLHFLNNCQEVCNELPVIVVLLWHKGLTQLQIYALLLRELMDV